MAGPLGPWDTGPCTPTSAKPAPAVPRPGSPPGFGEDSQGDGKVLQGPPGAGRGRPGSPGAVLMVPAGEGKAVSFVSVKRPTSASPPSQACNCDQCPKVSKDVTRPLVWLSSHYKGPRKTGECAPRGVKRGIGGVRTAAQVLAAPGLNHRDGQWGARWRVMWKQMGGRVGLWPVLLCAVHRPPTRAQETQARRVPLCSGSCWAPRTLPHTWGLHAQQCTHTRAHSCTRTPACTLRPLWHQTAG